MTLLLKDVTVRYGDNVAAASVNMSVLRNGLHGIFGPNGSGKSSVIKAVCGLEEYAGDIEVLGKNAREYSIPQLAKRLAYVPQNHEFVYGYTALEVVMMGDAGYRGLSPDKALSGAARRALSFLGAAHLENRQVTELSGGERQLIQLARAFNQDTPILMLDEPFAHLDFGNQIALWKKLREMAPAKIIIIASHDPNHIMWFCDSVFIVRENRVAACKNNINLPDIESLYPGQWRMEAFGKERQFVAPDI